MGEKIIGTNDWPEMFVGLYDKLTGHNADISYEFDGLEIDVPSSTSSEASHAHWKLNGTMRISTRNMAKN